MGLWSVVKSANARMSSSVIAFESDAVSPTWSAMSFLFKVYSSRWFNSAARREISAPPR
jgi:hypothetical protein